MEKKNTSKCSSHISSLADVSGGHKSFDSISSSINSKRRGAASAHPTHLRYLQQLNVGGRNGAASINRGIEIVRNAIFGSLGGGTIGTNDGSIGGSNNGSLRRDHRSKYWLMFPSAEAEVVAAAAAKVHTTFDENLHSVENLPSTSMPSKPSIMQQPPLRNGFRIVPQPPPPPPAPQPPQPSSSSATNIIN